MHEDVNDRHFDWIIVGSGFGGSVSALRLVDKGYRVLVIEKGRRFAPSDFPKNNLDLRRWMWMPRAGLKGFFQMSFLDHVTVLHGVGVGGGSLVYANTLPTPKDDFFEAASWAHLASWKEELAPHYATARRMLGATTNPHMTRADHVLRDIGREIGREHAWHPTEVAVYFGEPDRRVPDPYFDGEGPDRVGCTLCGACMTGCRVGAKNTLDRNYLYLAERRGLTILAETEVEAVRARPGGGFTVEARASLGRRRRGVAFEADRVVLAGGVMGTVPLLLRMKEDPRGLPRLSDRVGDMVRTNSESLTGVMTPAGGEPWSRGVAITSILHTDAHSHLEPVRYGSGSSFFRALILPHVPGETARDRVLGSLRELAREPRRWLSAYGAQDFAERSLVLLYMRTLEGTLSMRLGRSPFTAWRRGLVTALDDPERAPQAFIPEATELARRFADKVGGVVGNLFTETVLGNPSTAHILGGACMGASASEGVIDHRQRAFGYDGLYVIDGAAVSANPGVNPSLTITAMAERAMGLIPAKVA